MLGDMKQVVEEKLLPFMNVKWITSVDEEPELQFLRVEEINLKTGNKFYQFPLDCRKGILDV